MTNPTTNTPPPIEARGPSGDLFAKVVNLPSGGNLAIFRSQNPEGEPCIKIMMNAYGVQSTTELSGINNPQALSKMMELIDQKKCEEIYNQLRSTIAKHSPGIVSVFEMNEVLAQFGVLPAMKSKVGSIQKHGEQDYLAVRMEEKQRHGDAKPAIFILGHSVSDVVYFKDYSDRDRAFEQPGKLSPLIEALAIRQIGNDIVSSSVSRPRPR